MPLHAYTLITVLRFTRYPFGVRRARDLRLLTRARIAGLTSLPRRTTRVRHSPSFLAALSPAQLLSSPYCKSQHSSTESMLVAPDSMDSAMEVTPDFVSLEKVAPASMDSAMEVAPDSMDAAADSVLAPDSLEVAVEVSEMVVAEDVVPDSEDVVARKFARIMQDSEMVPDSVVSTDSETVAAEDSEMVLCPRCGTFHAGGVFGEACFQARRRARRCARCGLLHEDYDLFATLIHHMEKFDCEFYIPDVEKLEMDGDTILLPEHVIKKLDAKMKQEQ